MAFEPYNNSDLLCSLFDKIGIEEVIAIKNRTAHYYQQQDEG
jgi:hypothetical protein